MAKCINIQGEIYDNGKDCYAVVFDCRSSEGYKARAVIGPLVDSHQLPLIDHRAHDVRYCQSGDGFDVVWFYLVERGAPFSDTGIEPVPSLTTESVWEASQRIARGEVPTPEQMKAFTPSKKETANERPKETAHDQTTQRS